MQHGPVQVFVEPDVPNALFFLMEQYADMLVVLRISELPATSFLKLKMFLSGYCNETLFRQCSNLCGVVDILVEKMKIYLFNIDTLNASCKYCDDTIKHSVQEYKQHLNNFLSNTTVKEFMGTLQTKVVDRTGLESITLKLDESRADDTLKALNMFLYRFFGNCSKALNHYDTSPGCVCITWIISTSLVPTLRAMAEQHTLKYLVSQDILEFAIGNLQIKGNIYMCCMVAMNVCMPHAMHAGTDLEKANYIPLLE